MSRARSSHSHNPFDSDDEPSSPPVKVSSRAYTNPFDDDARVSNPQNPKHSGVSDAKNPFDDDDRHLPPSLKPQRRSSEPKSFFDDDATPQADLPRQEDGRERSRNQFKERVAASGNAAVKKGQRIRDAGASQAAKLVEGVKESTQNAFKSSTGHGNPRGGRGNPRNSNGGPLARDELLGGGSYGDGSRVRYDDRQFQKQDLEYKSMQELEGYALQKSEETTSTVQNCLKVAEDIKGDATRTLLSLHEQGEQIRKTHEVAIDIDQNLSTGEKLLGSLGGMFSKTWKPKKSRPVTGPAVSRNDSFKRRGHHLEQRVALGLNRSNSKGRTNRAPLNSNGQQITQEKLEMEKAKQDDALSDLSNVLDELKGMGIDMGLEISSQNVALDELQTDVTTLNDRVQGANHRARRLLGK